MRKIRKILSKSLTPKEDIMKWVNEGDIL